MGRHLGFLKMPECYHIAGLAQRLLSQLHYLSDWTKATRSSSCFSLIVASEKAGICPLPFRTWSLTC